MFDIRVVSRSTADEPDSSCERPQITQGDLSIDADDALATGIEFDDASEWRFTGQRADRRRHGRHRSRLGRVHVRQRAAVARRAHRHARVVQRHRAQATTEAVTGRASKMSYDYVARTLRMTGDASIQQGQTRSMAAISSTTSTTERVTSGSADCEDGFGCGSCPMPTRPTRRARRSPMSRLEALGVAKRYRLRQVVKDLSLSIESGEVVGLARSERRRQDDGVLHDRGARALRRRQHPTWRAATSRSCPCTGAPSSASAICRRKRRCSAS